MIGRAGELGAALAGRAPSLSQGRFPAYSTTMALSPNAVLVLNLAAFGVDSVVRSVQVSVGGSGMPGNRGQVYALLHRFSAQAFLCDDLRTYPENFLGKPSRNFAVMAGENWQLVVMTGTLVPATGTLTLSADVIPGQPDNGPAVLTLEDMGQGRGTLREVALGDPAVATEYVLQTVPSNVLQKLRSIRGAFTAAAATTKSPRVAYFDQLGNPIAFGLALGNIAASDVPAFGAAIGWATLEYGGQLIGIALPDILMFAAYSWQLVFGVGGVDNLGPAFAQVEEWAGSP